MPIWLRRLWRSKANDERGEVSSWLVCAAGLCAAAAVVGSPMQVKFIELINGIGGSGSTVPFAAPPPGPIGPPAPADAGPPTERSTEVLEDVVGAVDKGDDLGMSEGELDDVHDWLSSLTPEELDYVLANLTDEQIERIFHNAHSSSWRSNDWNDGERRDFYENLGRASQEERNRIADVLSSSDELDEDDYLDVLHLLEVDVSLGDKPNGEAVDALIIAALDPDYLDGPIANGAAGDGQVIIVNDADYERAWREHIKDFSDENKRSAIITFMGSRGFVDSEGRLWVQDSGSSTPGTAIHEVVHGYQHDALGSRAESLNEGVTEYFTREVIDTIDDPTTPNDEAAETIAERGYTQNFRFVEQLVAVVGEEAVAAAYFDGDIDVLEDAYIAATNRDSDDFDAMLALVDHRRDNPERDEKAADWRAAAALLTVETP